MNETLLKSLLSTFQGMSGDEIRTWLENTLDYDGNPIDDYRSTLSVIICGAADLEFDNEKYYCMYRDSYTATEIATELANFCLQDDDVQTEVNELNKRFLPHISETKMLEIQTEILGKIDVDLEDFDV